MAKVKPFDARMFSATPWATAEDKAKAANRLAAFVDGGFRNTMWNRKVYNTLSQHMYGHIAHFDTYGFYTTWFSTPQKRHAWVQFALKYGTYGHPAPMNGNTWGDVEEAFTTWLAASDIPALVQQAALEDTQRTERAELARLKEKYER